MLPLMISFVVTIWRIRNFCYVYSLST